jgi:hypothetical protein
MPLKLVGRDSAVGIATRYGMDGTGIELQRGRDFPHPSRGPTQPRIHVPDHSRGYSGWDVAITTHSHPVQPTPPLACALTVNCAPYLYHSNYNCWARGGAAGRNENTALRISHKLRVYLPPKHRALSDHAAGTVPKAWKTKSAMPLLANQRYSPCQPSSLCYATTAPNNRYQHHPTAQPEISTQLPQYTPPPPRL